MLINKKVLAVAGNGWGFQAVIKGLSPYFNNIEVCTTDTDFINEQNKNSAAAFITVAAVNLFTADVIICAGYAVVIPKALLEQKKVINIHYSLLPAYRGLHSTVWAIINNEPKLGYTVHEMNEWIDDGDIIYQYTIKNDGVNSAPFYMEHFNEHVKNNIGNIIKGYINVTIVPVKQDKTKASWVGKRNAEDCRINFNSTIQELHCFFRALQAPYPTPFFEFKKQKISAGLYRFHKSSIQTHIGRILNIDNEGVWIKVADGYLILNNLTNENGETMPTSKFPLGYRLIK